MAKTMTTDDAVMQLLAKVKQKKEEIEAAKKSPTWKTNCSIAYDPEAPVDKRINIRVETKIWKLVDLYAFLLVREGYSITAAKSLGVDLDPTYMGSPIGDWLEDLRSCVAKLTLKKKEEELKALDARVNKLVSADQRREMELRDLQAILD